MKITITIRTDNAAFDEENGGVELEVSRILQKLARDLADGIRNASIGPMKLRDVNGNTVGDVRVDDEEGD
jgi:hypothetical protein